VSISCLLLKRWRNEPLLKSHFSLGKYGFAINLISLIFLVFAFVLSFFPPEPNPTLQLMNWNILIYGVVVMFSLIYFWWKGRHVYAGPVEYVRKGE
jgi:choline transport protein